jgi:hypothetical protein
MRFVGLFLVLMMVVGVHAEPPQVPAAASERLPYQRDDLVVDLGVGLWASPFPVDYDGDGDNDLLVATADKPYNGVYFFENPTGDAYPVFKKPVRLYEAFHNLQVSYGPKGWEFLSPGNRYPDFMNTGFENPVEFTHGGELPKGKTRAKQWRLFDYDGDGVRDLIIGLGVWEEYGWDDAWNEKGEWTNGPLHGYVYVALNSGSEEDPDFGVVERVETTDGPVDVFGAPSPNFADFDGDGDLDLLCGSFLDMLTYFENTGTRTEPVYAPGRELQLDGAPLRMDLEMLQVVAYDWNQDGYTDLIVGEEDGRVDYVKHTGRVLNGLPVFEAPRFFRQEAEWLKFGALSTPSACDWDGDGDQDLIAGNTAGYLAFIENLDGGDPPTWAAPEYLEAAGERIRILAGYNGSIQGPAEAKWGYTVPFVADWNHDGLLDIVINSIWGEVLWYRNRGEVGAPELSKARPINVEWEGATPKPAWTWWTPFGDQLVTQWRTTPVVIDWNQDGLNDIVMLDHEGYIAFFEREKGFLNSLKLLPGKRIFVDDDGNPIQLNPKDAGGSGRRKITFLDWDGDGRRDMVMDSSSVDLFWNVQEKDGTVTLRRLGKLDEKSIGGHTTCPTVVDWDNNNVPDLVIGGEDGHFYYLRNPRKE